MAENTVSSQAETGSQKPPLPDRVKVLRDSPLDSQNGEEWRSPIFPAGPQGEVVWQEVRYGPATSKESGELFRGYLQVTPDDIPEAVQILRELAIKRTRDGKGTDFKWLVAYDDPSKRGTQPQNYKLGEYEGLQITDPRIAIYGDQATDVKEILQGLSADPRWKQFEQNREAECGVQGAARRPGTNAYIDATGNEWRSLNYNDQPGYSEDQAADIDWRTKKEGTPTLLLNRQEAGQPEGDLSALESQIKTTDQRLTLLEQQAQEPHPLSTQVSTLERRIQKLEQKGVPENLRVELTNLQIEVRQLRIDVDRILAHLGLEPQLAEPTPARRTSAAAGAVAASGSRTATAEPSSQPSGAAPDETSRQPGAEQQLTPEEKVRQRLTALDQGVPGGLNKSKAVHDFLTAHGVNEDEYNGMSAKERQNKAREILSMPRTEAPQTGTDTTSAEISIVPEDVTLVEVPAGPTGNAVDATLQELVEKFSFSPEGRGRIRAVALPLAGGIFARDIAEWAATGVEAVADIPIPVVGAAATALSSLTVSSIRRIAFGEKAFGLWARYSHTEGGNGLRGKIAKLGRLFGRGTERFFLGRTLGVHGGREVKRMATKYHDRDGNFQEDKLANLNSAQIELLIREGRWYLAGTNAAEKLGAYFTQKEQDKMGVWRPRVEKVVNHLLNTKYSYADQQKALLKQIDQSLIRREGWAYKREAVYLAAIGSVKALTLSGVVTKAGLWFSELLANPQMQEAIGHLQTAGQEFSQATGKAGEIIGQTAQAAKKAVEETQIGQDISKIGSEIGKAVEQGAPVIGKALETELHTDIEHLKELAKPVLDQLNISSDRALEWLGDQGAKINEDLQYVATGADLSWRRAGGVLSDLGNLVNDNINQTGGIISEDKRALLEAINRARDYFAERAVGPEAIIGRDDLLQLQDLWRRALNLLPGVENPPAGTTG